MRSSPSLWLWSGFPRPTIEDDGELEFTIKGPALIILVLIPFLGRFVLDYVHGKIERMCSKTADGGFPLPAGKKYHFFLLHDCLIYAPADVDDVIRRPAPALAA